jgi:serine/threonine protein phosphatase PrpC
MVDDGAIAAAMDRGTVDDVVWKLVETANEAGGVDNITVIVVDTLG